jgi:hypothetical protein
MLPVRRNPAWTWVPQFGGKAYDFDCANFYETLGSLGIRQHICGICFIQSGNFGIEVQEPFSLPQVASVHTPACA